MKSYKIHLIRHGLIEANEKGLYLGKTDLPLSALGLRDLLDKKQTAVYPHLYQSVVALSADAGGAVSRV